MAEVPIATQRMLWNRQLEQTCPTCGWEEPAGLTCSKCAGPVLPADWHPGPRYGEPQPHLRREFRAPTAATLDPLPPSGPPVTPAGSKDQAQDPAS